MTHDQRAPDHLIWRSFILSCSEALGGATVKDISSKYPALQRPLEIPILLVDFLTF